MFKKIAIIGLGLMGGSLAAACRKKFPAARVIGVTRSREALKLALRKKWIHEGMEDISLGAAGADLVVICTPVDTYMPMLAKIDEVAADRALVTDVGSVKGAIHKAIDLKKWKRLSFVGAHPMVGSHHRGIEASCPKLYERGTVILTRTGKTCPDSYKQASKFWAKLAGRIVHLAPDVHDELIAEISHLPHALAVCLVHAVSKRALPLAAKGFRDTTRIAGSSSSVWLPIFGTNKKHILAGIASFEKELKRFKKALRGSSASALKAYLDSAQKKRQSL
jgi:prephenate dehydrogenase